MKFHVQVLITKSESDLNINAKLTEKLQTANLTNEIQLAICLAVHCLVFLVLTNSLFFGPFFLEDFNSVLAN